MQVLHTRFAIRRSDKLYGRHAQVSWKVVVMVITSKFVVALEFEDYSIGLIQNLSTNIMENTSKPCGVSNCSYYG